MIRKPSLFLALTLATAGFGSRAEAKDCFILVHGNMSSNSTLNTTDVVDYWTKFGDFAKRVTNGFANNYALVRWNANNSEAKAYWEDSSAGAVAKQINTITAGGKDGLSHSYQCGPTDRFFVIAHSQGAQVMTYINGNAYPEALNYNKVLSGPADGTKTSVTVAADRKFDTAMAKITTVFTIGGAINGTQGMDLACTPGAASEVLSFFGKTCVPSLRTAAIYNPRTYTGDKLLKPMYSLGGYRSFVYSEPLLNGEDDGIINLRSQMNCKGSATEAINSDLQIGDFKCDSANKRHGTNSFNLASIFTDHDNERGASILARPRTTSAVTGLLSCGGYSDMAGTIRDCMSTVAR